MSYVIEHGIPIPPSRQDGQHRPTGPRSEIAKAIEAMEVGHSFAIESEREYMRARARLARFKPRRFITRKLPHEGWRIWRIE